MGFIGPIGLIGLICHRLFHGSKALQCHKFGVTAMMGHEFGMGAALDDAAMVEDHDAVGSHDGGEAMGDNHSGTAVQHIVEGGLQETFVLGVERRSGLVEDEQIGVTQQSTGNADALTLSAGEEASALAEVGLIAIGKLHDELVGLCCLGSSDDLFFGGIGASEGDVACHSVVEEKRVLCHDTDATAEVGERYSVDIDPVEENPALRADIIAAQEVGDGRLSTA